MWLGEWAGDEQQEALEAVAGEDSIFCVILSAIEHHWMVLTKVIKPYDLVSSFKIHSVLWKMAYMRAGI